MIVVIRGRLFGPALDGAGVPLVANWQGERLAFTLPQGPMLSERVKVDGAGFNRELLRLSWEAEEGRFAFFVTDETEQRALIEQAPLTLQPLLQRAAQQRLRTKRGVRIALGAGLAVVLLLLVGAGVAVGFAPRLAARAAEQVPIAQEARLGELLLLQTRAQQSILGEGPAVTALEHIGKPLTKGSRFTYRYYVADSAELNAYALPGGVVVVNHGLMQAADSAEELAGLLAHEIAHAELRHGIQAIVKSLGLRAFVAVLLGGFDPDTRALAAHVNELKFSREAEREADREGLRRLREARIDPRGMVQLLERLLGQDTTTLPAFLSTHPELAERLDWLKAELRSRPAVNLRPIELDYQRVKASLGS